MLEHIKQVIEYRDMITNLVKRDLRGRYKGSFFGFLWNFFNPMVQICVYIIVFGFVFRSSITNFPIYLIVGIMPWNFFSDAVCQGSACIFSQGDMVKKIYFPRETLPIIAVTSRFINFLINYAIVLFIIIVSGWGIDFLLLIKYLPLIFIIEYTFTLALTLFLSAIDVYFRDVEYMCSVFMMAAIWITPIMYTLDSVQGILLNIIKLNPMTAIVTSFQSVLYFKQPPSSFTLLKASGLSVLFLILAELAFIKLESRFAEEM